MSANVGRRLASIGLCGAAALLCAAPSEGAAKARKAPPSSNKCEATWRDAQARSDAGHLRQARDLFAECARPSCGSPYVNQCVAKVTQLDADIPTVVPLATDDTGAPVVNVQVKADGEVVALKLDGRAFPLDPGLHELSFSTWEHGVFATEKVMVVEGQRNRPIAVSLRKPGAAAHIAVIIGPVTAAASGAAGDEAATGTSAGGASATAATAAPHDATVETLPKRSGRSALPFILGGVGLASVGAGALMTYWGNKDNAALSSCSPYCAASDVTHIRTLYLASDITFGAGAAALGLATVLFFTGRHGVSDDGPAHATIGLEVQPTPTGGFASVKGSF